MPRWQDVVSPVRPVELVSALPVDQARASLVEVLAGRRRLGAPGRPSDLVVVDGAVTGSRVSFRVLTPGGRQAPPLEFEGTLEALDGGSLLWGSITAPTALGLPAAGLTAGIGLFLWWGGVPLVLVAIGVVAWAFLTIIVVASLQERRLGEADAVGRFLEAALDTPPIADANGRR